MNKSKTKPILFNTEGVKATLDKRKTQFRRVVKTTLFDNDEELSIIYLEFEDRPCLKVKYPDGNYRLEKVPYKKGDILYVRETWCDQPQNYCIHKADLPWHWDAEDTEHREEVILTEDDLKWKPSIHMPKEYARIFLKVTDVKVERLQDITLDNIQKEGQVHNELLLRNGVTIETQLRRLWQLLWNSASKDGYKWEDNPYVFVYEFERIGAS